MVSPRIVEGNRHAETYGVVAHCLLLLLLFFFHFNIPIYSSRETRITNRYHHKVCVSIYFVFPCMHGQVLSPISLQLRPFYRTFKASSIAILSLNTVEYSDNIPTDGTYPSNSHQHHLFSSRGLRARALRKKEPRGNPVDVSREPVPIGLG
ncbi:hypothetical protein K470DRAFT_45325 [Piedraia hortae CBS 480.64]|uniref:Uncharacterized protein n=1 Tax=Piedraia hortae CBS 480.64 TaxID=1314780 RepID=A0A6A7C109_9PEZI|nr:hypothetical protein K470DRAFT_45325 [Piedraia hortae CBS 480.64]